MPDGTLPGVGAKLETNYRADLIDANGLLYTASGEIIDW